MRGDAGPALRAVDLRDRRRATGARTVDRNRKVVLGWFVLFLSAICFEGLGRKTFVPLPGIAFYLLKDAFLVAGAVVFGLGTEQFERARGLFRGFGAMLALAVAVTLIQVFNPEQSSLAMGMLGVRAYWLWWLAPLVLGTALADGPTARQSVRVLAVVAILVAAYAALQFSRPATDSLNLYTQFGDVTPETTVVTSTGRPRVSSTFSYISGFAAFVSIVPMLLLSLGLGAGDRVTRLLAFVGSAAGAITMPMAGS
ncbi:MAG TPA: hypothetical protein VLS93_15345, partial [Anaeromyxobacteraceae bacterium]|nr:hypothetical protein [Anaeromyxobacteraceae bacterium]